MYSLKTYTQNIRGDVFGGITAAVVALPLALAFGISSGAGPVAGIFGAVFVGLFAAIFGGTPTQISGPTGPMTVVMTAMTANYIAHDPKSGLALAFTTVFLGGCLQILFGLMRIGKYIIMVPYPVISGFMTGIGVIIIILELAPLLGYPTGSNIYGAVTAVPNQLSHFNFAAVFIGMLSLAVVFFWRGKLSKWMPGPLLALLLTSLVSVFLFQNGDLERIGEIPSALPGFYLPVIQFDLLQSMLVNALMLAVLGSIDSLLTSLVADNITGKQHRSDQELIGQGIGNAVAGIFGGLPGAGATMRTMINIRAGGTGPLAGAVHAVILLAVVGGMGFLFKNIPLAALAGILIKVGIDIIDWPFLRRIHRIPRFPAFLMITVFLLTVFVDLITAVFVGVFIKNLVTINKLSDLQLGKVVFTDGINNIERLPKKEQKLLAKHAGEIVLFRITGPMSYAVGRGLSERFHQNIKSTKMLLVDISDAAIVGISSAMVLEDIIRKAMEGGAIVKLIGVNVAHHGELQQLGLIDLIGQDNCIDSVADAF